MPTSLASRDLSTARTLLHAASLLAEEIRSQTTETPEGAVLWPTAAAIELAASPGSGSPVADGRWDFYSGNPGIALFLAAYSRIAADRAYRDLCLRALGPIRDEIRRFRSAGSAEDTAMPATIGALVGTGSWIYALLHAGELLGDESLLADAHTLSTLITPEAILADGYRDLVFGSAGALLVLLALARVKPEPNLRGYTPLDLARLCAHKLAALDFTAERSSPVDVSYSERANLGLSHGLAGIGLALSRFHRVTQSPEAKEAVGRLLAALLELAASDAARSPELRRTSEASWCHGAPGLSIAFTEILEGGGAGESSASSLREARQMAVEWTKRAPFSPQDHLCCGNMGRAAALAYVAGKAGEPELFEAACQRALLVLRVAKTRQGLSLDYERPDASFFRGFAGIGYTLLTLAVPGNLPHVVALE